MNRNPLVEKSDQLAYTVYQVCQSFPREELLTSQLKQTALSVPLHIIQSLLGSKKTQRQFLLLACTSVKQTKYLLFFAQREKYFSQGEYRRVLALAEEIDKMLGTSLKKLESKIIVKT